MPYIAIQPIEHDGIRYDEFEELPELTEEQVAALEAVGAIEHLPPPTAGEAPGDPGVSAEGDENSEAAGTAADDQGQDAPQPEPAGDEATPAAGEPAAAKAKRSPK